jgi:hypothetical protein
MPRSRHQRDADRRDRVAELRRHDGQRLGRHDREQPVPARARDELAWCRRGECRNDGDEERDPGECGEHRERTARAGREPHHRLRDEHAVAATKPTRLMRSLSSARAAPARSAHADSATQRTAVIPASAAGAHAPPSA